MEVEAVAWTVGVEKEEGGWEGLGGAEGGIFVPGAWVVGWAVLMAAVAKARVVEAMAMVAVAMATVVEAMAMAAVARGVAKVEEEGSGGEGGGGEGEGGKGEGEGVSGGGEGGGGKGGGDTGGPRNS